MIQPDDIRRKAQNLYPRFLIAWLAGEAFFPHIIPSDRRLDPQNHAYANSAIQQLRIHSKAQLGFGYSVDWIEKRSRDFGRNEFPERIFFDSQDDFLTFIDKQAEFQAFSAAVSRLRSEFPALESWIQSHRQLLIDVEPSLNGLLEVLSYFRANPCPNRFARELSLSIDTKFIERHERVLRDWLDLVVPETVRSHETHFARRYGLRYAELHVLMRFLDPYLQSAAMSPWSELSLPLSALTKLHMDHAEVIIVENKVNLLTLPTCPNTLGLGALGHAVSELRQVEWLARTPITYWGDIDVEGFEILSALRAVFPHVQSLLMDEMAIRKYAHLGVSGQGRHPVSPLHLTPSEQAAFRRCMHENLRIEQERIPFHRFPSAGNSYGFHSVL